MSSDLKKYKLDEFAKLVKKQYQPNADEELIYIGLEHIEQQTLRINGYGNSKNVISQKYRFSSGDILFGKLRPYFRKVFRPKFDGVCSTDIWVIKAKKDFDQGFLFYFLANQSFIDACNSGSSGTRMPRADWDHLSETEWELPPLPTQHRIADILSALDDKIELNRQTNATLEAIAQAIFKEWFVNFNFPGATGEMIESDLGLIPKGWKVGRMGDFGDIVCGKTPSKTNENFFGGNIPFIKIPDMHNSVFIVETSDTLTHEGALSQKNKFLPPNSIIVSCIATIGLVSLTAERSQTNQQINAIIPKKDNLTHYIYFTARNIKEQLMELGSGGSATLNVNTSSFSNIKCVIPSEYVLSNFNFLVKPLFEGILANQQEMLTIAKCRDEFLPKLMNGEIDV
ncbi:MAG: restriction endonuclease subunit S [Anaerolineaceae bacterium]